MHLISIKTIHKFNELVMQDCLDFKSSLKNDLRLTNDVQSTVISYLQLYLTTTTGTLVS